MGEYLVQWHTKPSTQRHIHYFATFAVMKLSGIMHAFKHQLTLKWGTWWYAHGLPWLHSEGETAGCNPDNSSCRDPFPPECGRCPSSRVQLQCGWDVLYPCSAHWVWPGPGLVGPSLSWGLHFQLQGALEHWIYCHKILQMLWCLRVCGGRIPWQSQNSPLCMQHGLDVRCLCFRPRCLHHNPAAPWRWSGCHRDMLHEGEYRHGYLSH